MHFDKSGGTGKVTKVKGLVKAAGLLLLSIPLLWWAIRDIPIEEVYETLQGLSPAGLLGLSLVNGLIILLFTGRWWLVMHSLGQRLPLSSLVIYRLAGFGVSYFTPGPQFGGEPLQVHLLRKHHQLPGGTALAGVSVDKLVEILTNLSFLVIGILLIFKTQLVPISELFLILPASLLALPVVYMSLILLGRRPVKWLLKHQFSHHKGMSAFANIRNLLISAEEQVASIISNKPGMLVATLGLSSLTLVLMIFEYWLTIRLFGIQVELTQVIIMLTAARIAFLLPMPAGLGALEASQVASMQLFGLEPALGISVSLLIRARDFTLGSLGLGLWGLSANSSRPSTGVQTIPIPLDRRDKA